MTTAERTAPGTDVATRLNLWMITAACVVSTIGLSGDIARHLQTGTSITGDFLASWHLVLYGGVTGLALWLGRIAWVSGPVPMREAFGPTVTGMFVLAAGGVGDFFWHSAFGIEVELEALVSPPHLLLMIGLVLVLLGPLACLWRSASTSLDLSSAAVVGLCSLCITVTVMLFTGYLSLFAADVAVNGNFNPMIGTRVEATEITHGIAVMLWTSLALTAPWLMLRLRWRLPPGMLAVSFAVLALASKVSVSGMAIEPVYATLAAGVIADLVLYVARRFVSVDQLLLVTAGVVPVALWVGCFAALQMSGRLVWGATLWVGATALSTLTTTALAGMLLLARRSGPAQRMP